MKHLISLICAAMLLTACADQVPYEEQPPLKYDMSCKEISAAINEAHASLDRIKARRDNVTGEEVGTFILMMGTPTYGGLIAQKEAEDRIALLQGVAMQKKCK